MKKFFAAALVVSMLTVLLSGCMCQVADTAFQFDGSGTVEAKFGFSEEMVNAMNMRAEMTQNGFSTSATTATATTATRRASRLPTLMSSMRSLPRSPWRPPR